MFLPIFFSFSFNKFTALPSSAMMYVFYCIVEFFAFRVTVRLEDPNRSLRSILVVFLNILLGVFYWLVM